MAKKKAIENPEQPKEVVANEKVVERKNENVPEILKLYPQYKKAYVTENGFVHPESVPAYISKNATLYVNPYYNTQNEQ